MQLVGSTQLEHARVGVRLRWIWLDKYFEMKVFMATTKLTDITGKVCQLLEPLQSEDRRRVMSAAFMLLGEQASAGTGADEQLLDETTLSIGPNAKRWLRQNHIDESDLHEVFYIQQGNVEIIAHDVPGSSKRAKTRSCYLIAGIRSLLSTDQADFGESEAVEFCRHVGCYDSANHANTRKELGNQLRGHKETGFSLSAPGLRAAGDLVKTMAAK